MNFHVTHMHVLIGSESSRAINGSIQIPMVRSSIVRDETFMVGHLNRLYEA